MTTPYSRQSEVVAAVRDFLISVRGRPDDLLPRYGEVADVYGGVARAVAYVLNSVARDCAVAGEPDLSALVVLADTGLPGRLNGEVLDPQDATAFTAWQAELQRIRHHGWAEPSATGHRGGPT